jgi:recombinational DNA repair protein RecR
MTGYSILELRRKDDGRFISSVSAQMPTDIAEYIYQLVEKDQKKLIKIESAIKDYHEKAAKQAKCNHQWDNGWYGASVCNICGKIERD